MTLDYDATMNLPWNQFYTMQIRVMDMREKVNTLRKDLEKWGFDNRPPFQSDSFTITKLVQFESDLLYILSELKDIEEERRAKDDAGN